MPAVTVPPNADDEGDTRVTAPLVDTPVVLIELILTEPPDPLPCAVRVPPPVVTLLAETLEPELLSTTTPVVAIVPPDNELPLASVTAPVEVTPVVVSEPLLLRVVVPEEEIEPSCRFPALVVALTPPVPAATVIELADIVLPESVTAPPEVAIGLEPNTVMLPPTYVEPDGAA